MLKRKQKICFLFLVFVLLLSGCSEKPEYHWETYTEDQMQALFQENRELFDKLVEVIVGEEDFFEKGRRDEYEDAIIMSPYEEKMDLFSESGRQTVQTFFALKPYMVSYDDAQRFIKITFITQEAWESGGFLCWIKSETPGGQGGESEMDEFISYYGQNHYIEHITGNWYFFRALEPEKRGPFEGKETDEEQEISFVPIRGE